jgi:putative oxygen-independent coproporphyrinogen III oxidase
MPSVTAPMPSASLSQRALPAETPLGIYVHWPFCLSKCPYCDFNSHVRETVDQARWRAALLADLAHEAALTAGARVQSIFFGGGTPSLMPPQTVAAVIDAVRQHWPVADDLEITLEANPSSVEADRFADLASAGVNRLSLGLQALDDAALAFLGRRHSVAEGLEALDIAQRQFASVSFDLIYARPGQTLDAWRAELDRALAFGTDHLSLYQLTIEPGTAFAEQYRRKRFTLPGEDAAADLFELTQERTEAVGLPAYETSNHARPGRESRHNLIYWRYQPYVGVGPGAHGRRPSAAGPIATERHKKPETWLAAVETTKHGTAIAVAVSPDEQRDEAVMMGLRLAEGIDLAAIAHPAGWPRPDARQPSPRRRPGSTHGLPHSSPKGSAVMALDPVVNAAALAELIELGLMKQHGTRIAATASGHLLLNALLPRLLP